MDYRSAVAPKKGKKHNSKTNNAHGKKGEGSGETKFREAQQKLQQLVEKHLEEKGASSSEEEDDLETDNILGSVLRDYSHFGGKSEDLGRTQNFLENVFHSGAAACLICIATVKRNDKIWSCVSCYGFFHLLCIQRWGKDSIAHQKLAAEDRPGLKSSNFKWQCPKCRYDYEPSLIPTTYNCFCGQNVNPEFQPWLVPHSCGEKCNKELAPECGHRCLLLCHPGPCPPCPKTIDKECYCLKGGRKRVRCSEKDWSCGSVCKKKLACRQHSCPELCHPGECPPCGKTSLVTCDCSAQTTLKNCTQLNWQCDKKCGKALGCKEHICERVCHKGDCGPCPSTLPRSCPCGRNTLLLPCTQDVMTCGETCSKPCQSNEHLCSQRCHRGTCPPCMELLVRTCRCGQHQKEVSCHQKQYLCEAKCKRMRDCNVHPCKRKCCDGNCPSCEKPCGKTLSCGHHKCSSVCHRGACYPCNIVKQISCKCGATKVSIPCGAERYTNPPKCSKQCKNPPNCDHPKRAEHRCHFGDCPPCKLPCGKERGCGHACSELCHASVRRPKENYNPATPWDVVNTPYEVKRLPCPECPVPVDNRCFGGHEVISLPCHRAKPVSCGQECGRQLRCTNHYCSITCHVVEKAPSPTESGANCDECGEDCSVERECGHPCPQPCHPGECEPCKQIIKMRCHCSLTQLYVSCEDWTNAEDKSPLQSCGNQCPKNGSLRGQVIYTDPEASMRIQGTSTGHGSLGQGTKEEELLHSSSSCGSEGHRNKWHSVKKNNRKNKKRAEREAKHKGEFLFLRDLPMTCKGSSTEGRRGASTGKPQEAHARKSAEVEMSPLLWIQTPTTSWDPPKDKGSHWGHTELNREAQARTGAVHGEAGGTVGTSRVSAEENESSLIQSTSSDKEKVVRVAYVPTLEEVERNLCMREREKEIKRKARRRERQEVARHSFFRSAETRAPLSEAPNHQRNRRSPLPNRFRNGRSTLMGRLDEIEERREDSRNSSEPQGSEKLSTSPRTHFLQPQRGSAQARIERAEKRPRTNEESPPTNPRQDSKRVKDERDLQRRLETMQAGPSHRRPPLPVQHPRIREQRRSYRDAVSGTQDLRVVVMGSAEGAALSEEEATLIRSLLVAELRRKSQEQNPGAQLSFLNSGRIAESGWFLITCEDSYTMQWLLKWRPATERRYQVIKANEAPRLATIVVSITSEEADPAVTQPLLAFQNQALNIRNWQYLERLGSPGNWKLVFRIQSEEVAKLKEFGWRINYELFTTPVRMLIVGRGQREGTMDREDDGEDAPDLRVHHNNSRC